MTALNINYEKRELRGNNYDNERDRIFQYEYLRPCCIHEQTILRESLFSEDPLVIEARTCAEALSDVLWNLIQKQEYPDSHKIPELLRESHYYKMCDWGGIFLDSACFRELDQKISESTSMLSKQLLSLIVELSYAIYGKIYDDGVLDDDDDD